MIGAELFFVICFFGKLSFSRDVSDCYANDLNPYLKFGTKTAYEFVYERPRFGDTNIPSRILDVKKNCLNRLSLSSKGENTCGGCEPIQIWLLARHGTRYPGRQTIRSMHLLQDLKIQILRNHEERKNGRLCQPDLENFRSWNLNVTMADSNLLTSQGREDLRLLAKRTRSKYPSLFQQGYSQNLFEFRHTNSERTRLSAQAFAEGLFGTNSGIWIPPGVDNDPVLYPYGNCTSWIKKVENNSETMREHDLFLQGLEMTALIHNVSQRLGFLYDLSEETILLMYDMCRYNKAWSVNDRSAWCAAFTKNELKVLEYLNDLESYYDSGYGNELNVRLGCSPLKDMLQRFEQLEDDTVQRGYQPAGVFYFTHRKTIAMAISRLGLANRGFPLRHYDYHEQGKREWRISNLSPFTSNLAAVFFKCSSGEYNRVMFFLNEKRIDYDGCEVGLCSWSYIRNRFMDILQHCNLDWCNNAGSRPISPSLLIFIFPTIFFISFF